MTKWVEESIARVNACWYIICILDACINIIDMFSIWWTFHSLILRTANKVCLSEIDHQVLMGFFILKITGIEQQREFGCSPISFSIRTCEIPSPSTTGKLREVQQCHWPGIWGQPRHGKSLLISHFLFWVVFVFWFDQ